MAQNGTEVTCQHCGYGWEYSGELQSATCPSCQRKTATDVDTDDVAEA